MAWDKNSASLSEACDLCKRSAVLTRTKTSLEDCSARCNWKSYRRNYWAGCSGDGTMVAASFPVGQSHRFVDEQGDLPCSDGLQVVLRIDM